MSDCSRFYLAPQTTCGIGQCINSSCVCQEGWSSIGDQALIPGAACNINIVVVRVLWAFVLLTILPSLGSAIWAITTRAKFKRAGSLGADMRRRWRIWAVPIGLSIYCVTMLIVCLGKIIDPSSWWIGLDPAATVLFFIAVAGSSISAMNGSIATIDFAVMQIAMTPSLDVDAKEMLKTHLQRMKMLSNITMVVALCSEIASIGVLWAPDSVIAFTAMFGGGKFVTLTGIAFIVFKPILGRIHESIDTTIKDLENNSTTNLATLRAINIKMARLVQLCKVLPIQGIALAIVCMWPFLVENLSYIYPIMVLGTGPSLAQLAWATTTTKSVSEKGGGSPDTVSVRSVRVRDNPISADSSFANTSVAEDISRNQQRSA